ncbi:MAG: transporter substrate-binding domain-containing protein [Acidobacteriaceae bacterium]
MMLALAMATCGGFMLSTTSRGTAATVSEMNSQPQSAHSASSGKSSTQSAGRGLPLTFARETGDLNSMVKRRRIRALVFYSRTGFFYVNGRPQGVNYEALRAFEEFVNQKLHTGRQHVQVTFIPIRPDQAEADLTQGVGDLIAYGLVVTPERERRVAFSIPIATDIKQIVVTGKGFGRATSLQDLSGKKIYVNPLSTYYDNLQKVNVSLHKQGKPPILIEKADTNLGDEDLLEMVNAGIIPATVTITERANLWASVLPNITAHPDLVIASQQDLAWAMRKNNPELKAVVDEFAETHRMGTSFGNTLLRRYLQNTKWIKNPTTPPEIKKFNENIAFFKKYSAEYSMDYLLVVAQGYQESMLNQSARNGGAVGIMQVKPALAAAPPISVHNVTTAQNNIEAGVKMLHTIEDKYFNDPKINPMNRLLLTFAAYNAGPTRIAALRRQAAAQGLNPNVWFGNVELVVAQRVGQVTVQYVSNIYKYYVAYKLVVQQGGTLQ